MEEEKGKGPQTKLLQCEGLIVRIIKRDPKTENTEFEVYTANSEGEIVKPDPIFKGIETTPPTESIFDRTFTAPEHRKFNFRVLNKDKENKSMDDALFMEIAKTDDPKKSLYHVTSKDMSSEESIGTIECHVRRLHASFRVNGLDSAYVVEEQRPQSSALEFLMCCGFVSRIEPDELTIFEAEKVNGSRIEDPGKQLGGMSREPLGKIVKLKKKDAFSKARDIFVSFPKSAYDEERSLLLAVTFLISARFFTRAV